MWFVFYRFKLTFLKFLPSQETFLWLALNNDNKFRLLQWFGFNSLVLAILLVLAVFFKSFYRFRLFQSFCSVVLGLVQSILRKGHFSSFYAKYVGQNWAQAGNVSPFPYRSKKGPNLTLFEQERTNFALSLPPSPHLCHPFPLASPLRVLDCNWTVIKIINIHHHKNLHWTLII